MCLEAIVEGTKMVLCNIYAPNKSDPPFFHELNHMLGNSEGQIILAGDFNEVMDPILDKSSRQTHLLSKGREAIHMLSCDLGLTDIWRQVNP